MFNFDFDKLAEIANSSDNYFLFHDVKGGFIIIHSESIVAAEDNVIYTCHNRFAVQESLSEICGIIGFEVGDPDE